MKGAVIFKNFLKILFLDLFFESLNLVLFHYFFFNRIDTHHQLRYYERKLMYCTCLVALAQFFIYLTSKQAHFRLSFQIVMWRSPWPLKQLIYIIRSNGFAVRTIYNDLHQSFNNFLIKNR